MAFWKDSMINQLSNIINRNRSAAKISQVLCSSANTHKHNGNVVQIQMRRRGRQAHDAGAWSRRKPKTKQRAGATIACYTFPIFLLYLLGANTEEIHNNTSYYSPKNLSTINHFSTGMVYHSKTFIF